MDARTADLADAVGRCQPDPADGPGRAQSRWPGVEPGWDAVGVCAVRPGQPKRAGRNLVALGRRARRRFDRRRWLWSEMDTVARPGAAAPAFELPDIDGRVHRLQ